MGGKQLGFGDYGQSTAVTASKDDAPAAHQTALTKVVVMGSLSGGGGLIQTAFG